MARSIACIFGTLVAIVGPQRILAVQVPASAITSARTITFRDLPKVTYDVLQSHLSAVRVDGKVVLTVLTSPDGDIQSMDAPGRWSWHFSATDRNIHHRFVVTGGHAQYDGDIPTDSPPLGSELPAFLDTVRDELGLPEAWQKVTVISAVGGVGYDVNDSGSGSPLIRLRQSADDVRIGLSASGEPLFYDLRLPVSVPDGQSGATPTRLIVSHNGRLQLALAAPRQNAITSVMWSPDPTIRGVTYQHFVLQIPSATDRVHTLMKWQCGAYYSCYDDPTTGYTCWWQDQYCESPDPPPPPPPDTGGCSSPSPGAALSALTCGGGTTETPQQQQRDLYVANNCSPVPDAGQFLDRSGYSASGLANYFSFDAFKISGADYVLVNQALVNGLAAMQSELDTMSLPGLSTVGAGSGYRTPGSNSNTPCGDHCYGTAVDLTIRNSSGAHDCHIWNVLAAAANAAGGWVEPASMTAPSGGVPDHFHVAFDGRTNTDYGDACTN